MRGRCNDTAQGDGACAGQPARPAFDPLSPQARASAVHGEAGVVAATGAPRRDPLPWREGDQGDLLVSAIFRTRVDPQRKQRIACRGGPECMEYMGRWLESAARHNLTLLVLHDGLSLDLIRSLQGPRVRFYWVKLGPYTLNDERFRALSRFLDANHARLGRVLMTDMHDAELIGDPFRLMFGPQYRVFAGSEPNTLSESNDYILRRFTDCGLAAPDRDAVLFNSGILGGDASHVRAFARAFADLLSLPGNEDNNCNMPAFNVVIQRCYRPQQVFHQYPLHSAFAALENATTAERPFFIRHK